MMDKAIAQQMFRDMSRRVSKFTEGHAGTFGNLAVTAGRVEEKISAFLELKDSAPATQVLSTAERLQAELEKLKNEVINDGVRFDLNLQQTLMTVCGIAEIDAFGREIRDKASKLDAGARITLVQDAIKERKTSVLSALLNPNVPDFLTDIAEADRTEFCNQLFKTHAPVPCATRQAASDAFDLTEGMIRQALEMVTSTLGLPGLIAEAAKTKKRGAAEAALGMKG